MSDRGSRPVPDPTVLTTELVDRAVAVLNERLALQFEAVSNRLNAMEANTGQQVAGVQEVIETRLAGMDRANELRQRVADERVDGKVAALQGVHEEKFKSIATQFLERDVRDERSSRDSKTAVDAALSAAEKAVGAAQTVAATSAAKSEATMDRRVEQIQTLITTTAKAVDDKFAALAASYQTRFEDLKERLDRWEGRGAGAGIERRQTQTSNQLGMQAIAMIVGAIGVTTAIVMAFVTLMKP